MVVALSLSVFLFKDRIINQFIREANKQLNTPINVKEIDVSVFQDFPHLSIVMHDVYVEDSHPATYPLLTAKQVSFQMNIFEVWNGEYNVKGLRIEDSETSLKINNDGKSNYAILKESPGSSTSSSSISFELNKVSLKNTRVLYLDMTLNQQLIFSSNNLTASISSVNDIYDIDARGQLNTDTLSIQGKLYSSGKSFEIDSELIYDDINKSVTIKPSSLKLRESAFTISGTYNWKERNEIDLAAAGKDTDIQTILSLLPESTARQVEKYQSKGEVYFSGKIKGEISKTKSPSVSIDFGFSDATIFHPDYKSKITGANLTGSFASSNVSDPAMATLVLKNVKASLNGEPFQAELVISNLEHPDVISSFKGKVDAGALSEFFPMENVSKVSGTLVADVSLAGKIELLKNRTTAQRVNTQGTIDMHTINLTYGKRNIPLKNLSGSLQFSNNDLALSNVAGVLGKSDFVLNGFFKNVITYLLFEDQPVGIETDLKSNVIDLNELMDLGYGASTGESTGGASAAYKFNISKNVYLNFNCDVKSLYYKRFHGREIKGDLLVKNKVAVSRNLALKTMGGNLSLSGIVDANNNKAIDVVCTSKLHGIHLDSVFYVFQNFDQDFIKDTHLKGQVTADVNLELALNQSLKLYPETLTADIGAVIKNGELNNFEPLKKLNKYLDDEGLSRLRFSDLQNDIHIENKTVYIPQMEVRSNVTGIKISGTHTFDQRIDYRLITPLQNRKVFNVSEAGNAIEADGSGQTKLFLKIVGTTDDYRIAYDTEAVKKKIATDLKKEVRELKDAFKNKGAQQKKEQEVAEDEYFDW